MKRFFAYMFASMFGTILAFVFFGFFAVASIGVLVSLIDAKVNKAEQPNTIPSILLIDLTTSIEDAPPDEPMLDALMRNIQYPERHSLYLLETTRAIQRASRDPDIKGILLYGNLQTHQYGSGYPALNELRKELEAFSKQGKPVYAWLEQPSMRDYYLMSIADEVFMHPAGSFTWKGLAAMPMFLGDAFERYGVGVQVVKTGAYKSAAEAYTRSSLSGPARKQLKDLLQQRWNELLSLVQNTRGIQRKKLEHIANKFGLLTANEARKKGFVDYVVHRNKLEEQLADLTGSADASDTFEQIKMWNYLENERTTASLNSVSESYLAVVYVEGAIFPGNNPTGDVNTERLVSRLSQLKTDNQCKGVVLRVNSPGGSAQASDTILQAAREVAAKKPLYVSMGSYAASGGYWISLAGKAIYADPGTVTGSIGVIGMFPNIQQLANEYGVTFDTVKTGPLADMYSMARPQSKNELKRFKQIINEMYQRFLNKVAKAREMELEQVQELAGGRVWTGKQAQQKGLVDGLKSMNALLQQLAKETGLGKNPTIAEYPRRPSNKEWLRVAFGEGRDQEPALDNQSLFPKPLSRFMPGITHLHRVWSLLQGRHMTYALLPFVFHDAE